MNRRAFLSLCGLAMTGSLPANSIIEPAVIETVPYKRYTYRYKCLTGKTCMWEVHSDGTHSAIRYYGYCDNFSEGDPGNSFGKRWCANALWKIVDVTED